MSATPKTIQIFLPGGEPRGIRVAEITTRIVQDFEIPRSRRPDFRAMPESELVGLYFLLGEEDADREKRLYIGQTGELASRLVAHNQKKDFWSRALVLISRTNSLTQTHALFLEWYCIQQALKAERFALENGTGGSRPHTPAPLEADCMEIFETGSWLLSTLGFPFFDTLPAGIAANPSEEAFFLKGENVDGCGLYLPDGFLLRKDSRGRKDNVQALSEDRRKLRQKYIDAGIMRIEGKQVILNKDHYFSSPSQAALVLLGRTSNGWKEWKTRDGRTLDEVKRQTSGGE